ncbi:hypothetical protein ABE65_010435 [Fictibacillus phosphorivorans]|uniref:Uncharacterized protein n=1 Tax=Fictibacillus phosphorivorans TaxID=1221500 RepID=A0A160IMI3_9BACL|nr:HNH endonuclease [Fictibacillus phosphorivorans]ANC77197.1 hypothetical protein ABE65_010435 [Fictibacillus phosphorivorans]
MNDVLDYKLVQEYTRVPGYSDYWVDLDQGIIYSIRRGYLKKLKSNLNDSGYYMNTLYDENGSKTFTTHAIVMAAKQQMLINSWLSIGLTVHHRNENPEDNSADNLELRTRTAQALDYKDRLSEQRLGKPRCKVTENDIVDILLDFSDFDGTISKYASVVADKYDMTRINAYLILKRKTWKHVDVNNQQLN